jgi:hypothetical protein
MCLVFIFFIDGKKLNLVTWGGKVHIGLYHHYKNLETIYFDEFGRPELTNENSDFGQNGQFPLGKG